MSIKSLRKEDDCRKIEGMWKKIRRLRIFPDFRGPAPYFALGVKRHDGFTIIREMQDDPPHFEYSGWETYSCKGPLGKFKIIAGRRERGEQTRIYTILLNHLEPHDAKLCRTYAKEIEDALINGWPWKDLFEEFKKEALKAGIRGIQDSEFVPVDEVLFYDNSKLLTADDLV